MKKYITFNNVLALLALIIIPLLFVPCFYANTPDYTTNKNCWINFYQRAFGGFYYPNSEEAIQKEIITGVKGFPLYFNGGLFTAFLLLVLGIVALVLVNFLKKYASWCKFGGGLLLIASGVLFCCALPLANVGRIVTTDRFALTGATIAFGVIIIVIGSFSLLSLLFRKKNQTADNLAFDPKN